MSAPPTSYCGTTDGYPPISPQCSVAISEATGTVVPSIVYYGTPDMDAGKGIMSYDCTTIMVRVTVAEASPYDIVSP